MRFLRSLMICTLVAAVLHCSTLAWGRTAKGRNRGRLATLTGIRKGKAYPMINPSTGRMDRKARVVSKAVDPFNKVPFATVRFSNGFKADVAAERLHLVGKPLGVQKRYMTWHNELVVKSIGKHLGLDQGKIKKVRVTTMSGRAYVPRKRARKKKPHLGRFLTFFGPGLKPGDGLNGYQWEGRAYVHRNYAAFDYETRTHEVLHALSEPFAEQAMNRGYYNLMEGINQYFTYHVIRPKFGIKLDQDHAYAGYYKFAKEVAGAVGHDQLKRIVFSQKGPLFTQLAKKMDREMGKRGAFYKACKALERGEEVSVRQ